MNYQMLDLKGMFAPDFISVMAGYEAIQKDGWKKIGTPMPMMMGEVAGLLQIVARSRET